MKCTDIQINDWVYLSEATKYAMRVTSIDEDHCYLDFDGNGGDPFDGIYGENGIAPIPLTEEMLKLNDDEEYVYWVGERRGNALRVTIAIVGDSRDWTISGDFQYAHEVQHALRLAGLGEIADNFKIE